MSKSAYKIRSFINRGPFRPAIASVVEHSGCKIVGIFPDPEPQGYYVETWGFHIQPNQTLRDLMSVNEPFLLIATEISDAQQREEEIRRELQQAYSTRDCKFCTDFAVLVTDSSLTEDAASEIARSSGVNLIHFSFEELQEAGAFLRRIRSRLFVRDLYWLTTAVRSARQFYGRHSLLDELETYLVQSKTHVGLFGLRKMGKTSLLYQLFDALRRRKGVLLCYLDMQRIDSISQTAEYFLWSLGEAIFSALARVRVPGLKLFGQYATFYDIADRQQVAALFDHDMQQVLDRVSHQLVIAFDEIELMSPSRRGSNWHSEFGRAWRMLRGVAQQSPGRISFLVAGTNPQVVETSRFHEEHDNPIYNYFRTVYLPPFSEADTGSLLRGVGHKLGLSWSQQAVSLVHQLTGGHPLLVRLCGSVMHRSLSTRTDVVEISEDNVRGRIDTILSEAGPHLRQMIDVIADDYPDEYMLLDCLAQGREGEFRELASAFPDDIAHLQGYGLVYHSALRSFIAVELLQTLLQRRQSKSEVRKPAASHDGLYRVGDRIQSIYRIESQIGHRGGFAEVYLCTKLGSSDKVAVKVLPNGSLSDLLRETEVLENYQHPNMVRFHHAGKTDEGYPFIVMEYLAGPSLREYCTRATRMSPGQISEIAIALLDVLTTIHPDTRVVSRLKSKAELTPDEFMSLEKARHGYVHRDIKPENIIIVDSRGPVLIDFNIASRVGAPTVTVSSTPGYLPPDALSGRWEPDVDLYQLGVTLLQAATGLPYDKDNLDDLRETARLELPPKLANVLLKLCEAERANRFRSAVDALRRLK